MKSSPKWLTGSERGLGARGSTETPNNLTKRVKRVGHGFRNFEDYPIRVLLYAGKPNRRVGSIVVRGDRNAPPGSEEPHSIRPRPR